MNFEVCIRCKFKYQMNWYDKALSCFEAFSPFDLSSYHPLLAFDCAVAAASSCTRLFSAHVMLPHLLA